ncbi:MAG: LysR substrate-binding domain-containing protein [Pseudomonadota bacterium]
MNRIAHGLKAGSQSSAARISSTEPMIAGVLAPRLDLLFDELPDLRIEFDVDTGLSDLNAGDVDIAIRLAKPTVDTLIGRKLPRIELGLYCTRTYLSDRAPTDLDLAQHHLLWLDTRYGAIPENQWLKAQNLEQAVRVRSSSIKALEAACLSGVGIAPLPVFSSTDLDLVKIPSAPLPPRQPWIVFHRDTRANKTLKKIRDWIFQVCTDVFG